MFLNIVHTFLSFYLLSIIYLSNFKEICSPPYKNISQIYVKDYRPWRKLFGKAVHDKKKMKMEHLTHLLTRTHINQTDGLHDSPKNIEVKWNGFIWNHLSLV